VMVLLFSKLSTMSFPCIVCEQNVRPKQHALECDSCFQWQHRLCNSRLYFNCLFVIIKQLRPSESVNIQNCDNFEYSPLPSAIILSNSKDILLSEALSVSKLLSDQNKKSWYSTILSLLKYLKLDLRFVMNSKTKNELNKKT
jgi:hypothetical protein